MSWRKVSLGEISTMKYGKLPPKEISPDAPYPIFTGYRIAGYCNEYLYEKSQVIVVARGVGGTGDVKLSPEKCWITNLSIVLATDSTQVDKKFLCFLLGLERLKERLNTGAAQAQITIENLAGYNIRIPPLTVQQKIAEFVSAYDDLIENNKRRIGLLEEAARLLYSEWFVHLRFPGHEHAKIKDGVPERCERRELGSILTLKRGYDLPDAKRVPGTFPIVSSSGVTGFHNQSKAIAPGVVTGRYGTLGEVYYIESAYWPLNTALYVVDYKGHHPLMVFHLLKALLKGIITEKAAVPGVDRNVLHTMPVTWPPRKLQEAFVEIVREYQNQLRVLHEMNQKLAQARDLLLPRLMNGEIEI